MKVKDVKEMIKHLDDEEDFKFLLFSGYKDQKELHLPLDIKSHGAQFTDPITNYIELQVPQGEIKCKTTFPNVFYIKDRLVTITRVEYNNGQIAYKEESIDGRYKNVGVFYP